MDNYLNKSQLKRLLDINACLPRRNITTQRIGWNKMSWKTEIAQQEYQGDLLVLEANIKLIGRLEGD